ncbi:MAG: MerR family transcriptional regulator [Pseudomonadota bacterium]
MNKSPDAFRTISEVAEDLDLTQHVLRFWETRFNQIKPMKRGGGRRYYRPEDVELVRGIKGLLYDEGYTIRGVQRLLKEHGNKIAIEFGKSGTLDLSGSDAVEEEQVLSQPAVDVVEFTEPAKKPKPAGGLFRRSKADTVGVETGTVPRLSKDDRAALQSTLQDLLECKRLLDQTRQS